MAKEKKLKEQNLDMTEGKIVSKVVLFAIPLLIGNLFQQLYNMVDSIVVGNFCAHTAFAAVGTAGIPMQIMIALFLGIGTGATILVSQHKGADNLNGIKTTIRTASSFLVVVSPIVTLLGVFVSPYILGLMNVPDDVIDQANTYLVITFIGTLPNLGYNMNAGILRGIGDSRSPLKFLILSTCVNIVLDLLFVAVFGWDVAGVAIATVIAQFTAWIYSIIYIKKHYPHLGLKVFVLDLDKGTFKHMVRLGLPLGFNNAIFSLGFLILNSLVNSQGSIFMAGANAAGRVDNLIFLPITSFAAAATTFAGQNVGAGKHDRLKKGFWQVLAVALITNTLMSVIILSFGKYILGIFNPDPAVIEVGLNCIWWIAPWYWIYNIFAICNNYMNGAGEVRVPTISSLIMFWGARIPAAYLFFDLFGRDYIYAAYPVSWTVGALISGGYYLSGRWRRHYLSKAGNLFIDEEKEKKRLEPKETHVYFIRHCQSDKTNSDEMLRPLTQKGQGDTRLVTAYFDDKAIDKVYSSPMKRAVDTVMDMAVKWGHNIEVVDDFRERRATTGRVEDFDEFSMHQWSDFDFALEGGESLRQVQTRAIAALDDILPRVKGQKIAISCHGLLLCSVINHFVPTFGYNDFVGMLGKEPWIVHITFFGEQFKDIEYIDIV